uniref:Uncharacterized protein n=1 Tax=Oryza meridionalis TaxID=40149 RepID=A0A0E0F2T0_9ORYZ
MWPLDPFLPLLQASSRSLRRRRAIPLHRRAFLPPLSFRHINCSLAFRYSRRCAIQGSLSFSEEERDTEAMHTLMVSLVTVSLMTLVILHDITFFPEVLAVSVL